MKYKHIKSVAHNLGHSFLSDTNATMAEGRYTYVPQVLFADAAQAGVPAVHIDLTRRAVRPESLATPLVMGAVEHFAGWLPALLESHNVHPAAVVHATIEIAFDYARLRRSRYEPVQATQEFTCTVSLTDDRGVVHQAHPDTWWAV